MGNKNVVFAWGAVAIAFASAAISSADTPKTNSVAAAIAELAGQKMLKLPVRVVDPQGKPLANAKVIPWALRSSQGHGWWRKGDEPSGVSPDEVVTDEQGLAVVLYPEFRDIKERTRTLAVSLQVDHQDFAYVDSLHIDVPLEAAGPYEITLAEGVSLEIRPLIDGQPAELDSLFALWSDGRSWRNGGGPLKTPEGTLMFPAMPAGDNSVLLVKLDGDRATHFSKIIEVQLKTGEAKRIDIPLHPGLHIEGALSDNVPRPVRQGRIKFSTLPPNENANDRVSWFSWAPIKPDGTFTIDGWPAGEPVQLIALCEGYIATSGSAPDAVEHPPRPKTDYFRRPQVFEPVEGNGIEVSMTPLASCVVTAVDEDGKGVAGVSVESWPNVGWWNVGSQIYADPLVRSERHSLRNYVDAIDSVLPVPFRGKTDAHGKVTLELPAGREDLAVSSDIYELPILLGHREVRVQLAPPETTQVTLALQPRGTEKLGEWDNLVGVVFGCSTREGRRICALPSVTKKLEEFTDRLREAKNQRDPEVLSQLYAFVAEAFQNVGDQEEASKWRDKAAQQKAIAEGK